MPASPHFIQRLNKMMGPQSCAACALTHNPKAALSEVQRGRAEPCVRAEPRWKHSTLRVPPPTPLAPQADTARARRGIGLGHNQLQKGWEGWGGVRYQSAGNSRVTRPSHKHWRVVDRSAPTEIPLPLCFCSEGKVAQLCLTLCNPMDYTVCGILQATILEWVAFPFSSGCS